MTSRGIKKIVDAVSAATVDGGTEIRVADAGPGIPPDMRDKVFSPFVQVDAEQNAASLGNRGLGLSFCRLVAEAHGGRIWVDDASSGTTFCLRISHAD